MDRLDKAVSHEFFSFGEKSGVRQIGKPGAESSPAGPRDKVDLSSKEKELTIMCYLDGESTTDISLSLAKGMLNLEKSKPGENINVVAQLGRRLPDYSGLRDSIEEGAEERYKDIMEDNFHIPVDGDWEGIRRYEIRHDPHERAEIPVEKYLGLERKMPRNPLLSCTIADMYWDRGEKEKALPYYEKARQLGITELLRNPDSDFSWQAKKEFKRKTRSIEEAYLETKNFESKMVRNLPEDAHMKDPAELRDFVRWGMKEYPARHYLLVISGHGGAWQGTMGMTPAQLSEAVQKGTADAGKDKKIDAIFFNSCYMGSVESALEMKNASDVVLASENYALSSSIGEMGNIVDDASRDIGKGRPFDARKFAGRVVEKFGSEAREIRENIPEFEGRQGNFFTLSAIDNSQLDGLADSWKKFMDECKKNNFTDKQLFEAVNKSKNYPGKVRYYNSYGFTRDLGDIMDNVRKGEDTPAAVKDAASGVKEALGGAVIREQHEGVGMEGSQGLTIWVPSAEYLEKYPAVLDSYNKNSPRFAGETGWGDRLLQALENRRKQK